MRLSIIIIALFWFGQTFGQINASSHPKTKLQQLSTSESTLEWTTFKKEVSITPDELVTDKNLLELSTDDELSKISTTTDELGYEHRRYLQHYKGIPIEHAWYFVHAKNGKTRTASGKLAKGLRLDVRPVITQENALNRIVGNSKSQKYAWKDAQVEENFKKMTNDPDASFYPEGELLITKRAENTSSEEYVLAYRFEIFSLEPHEVKAVYVDAKNGAIIKTEDLLHNAHSCTGHAEENTQATGVSNYNGTVRFKTELVGSQYRLNNNTGRTLNAKNTKDYSITEFKDTDNHWTGDRDAVDAHWGIEQAYDYFLNKHNRDSYDDNGSPVTAWVHFGNNSNAAAWNSVCSCIILGDGDGEKYNALTSLDIIAHEYAHGVTRYSTPLRYYGEAGALNESFSDIFGALIEHHHKPSADNWIIGEDIVKKAGKQGIRNLANPKDPTMMTIQPDTYQGEHWYEGPLDNGGIHTNSGVQNYWFYLLVNGGSGVNDNGDYYSVKGIGIDKAAKITYRNLTVYMKAGSTYVGAAVGSTSAAKDLFGVNSFEYEQVRRAWCAVGMPANYCGQYDTSCSVRDSLALVALYNSTQGNTWKYRWNLNNPISTWRGVTVSAEGCVTRLKLPSNNRLKGTLPPEFGNLLDLEYLKIDNNADLVGNIPPEFGNLTKLVDAFLYFNNFSGSLPAEIGNLESARQLMLDGNDLTGNLPASIKNLPNTVFLTFSNNQLENLPDLSGLPSTYKIYVRGNKLTFEDIAPNRNVLVSSNQYKPQRKIGEIKTVQLTPDESYTIKLNIDTYIEDNVYKWYKDGVLVGTTNKDEFTISDFTNVKAGVYTCQVTNSGASSLSLESYPVSIQVSPISCRLRDSLALVEFFDATKGYQWTSSARWDLNQPMDTWYGLTFSDEGCVTEIDLVTKRLKGYLPAEIGNLLSLERLNIGSANFSNTPIPPEIGKLTSLKYLKLFNSKLSGSIPPEIGNLVNLTTLDLGRNNLTGIIPLRLGRLTNLIGLILYRNQLTGSIPPEISNMASLSSLILSNNQLSDLPFINHLSPNYTVFINNKLTFKDILPNMAIMKNPWTGGSYKTQLPIGEAATFTVSAGDKVYIDLDIDHDIADNVYKWYKDGTLVQTQTGDPTFNKTIQSANDAGVYTCQVTNAGAPELTLQSENYTVQFEAATAVYPGDFNNDGKVDGTDPLFWGLTYGRTGIPRPNASLTWEAQPCYNWNISHLGVNGKHQDANGDGIVNKADLEVINRNYGSDNNYPIANIQRSPLSLHYTVKSSRRNEEGKLEHVIDINLVNNANDAPISLHGISFGFQFVPEYDNMNYLTSEFDVSNSWLGDEKDLTVVAQNYPDDNRASYTITRNDLEDKTASTLDPIVKLIIVVDDIETNDPLNFILSFDSVKASSASTGDIMSIEAGGNNSRIAQEASLTIENIYPNPTHAAQGITLMLNTDTDYGEGYINVTDILGKTLIQQPVNLKQGEQELHVLTDRLPSGIYTVHLRGSSWHSHAQQFIIRNE